MRSGVVVNKAEQFPIHRVAERMAFTLPTVDTGLHQERHSEMITTCQLPLASISFHQRLSACILIYIVD